jgi:hypothetical protein
MDDLVETGLDLPHEFAEAWPLSTELGRVVRRGELIAVSPLDIVDEMAAIITAVQADRHEAGLARHEPGAFRHQAENFILSLRFELHGGNLGNEIIVLANFGHGILRDTCFSNNA